MAEGLNRVMLLGNLGQDPETLTTQSHFLARDHKRKDNNNMSFNLTEEQGRCWNGGKRIYATKRDAKRGKRAAEKRCGRRLHIYRCGYCDGWHMTKQRQHD